MRPPDEYDTVRALIDAGKNDCEISRATGIPRTTVRQWRHNGRPGRYRITAGMNIAFRQGCPICANGRIDAPWYAYLLGLYLGDGYLSECPRRVFRLRIVLDQRYPGIIDECRRAIGAACLDYNGIVGTVQNIGCVEVTAYWKHWPCLFPQHGRGRKHLRLIQLRPWQQEIVTAHPDRLLRGLIHSDGYRGNNRVNGSDYPRYQFTNHSQDIREIFCRACDDYGVAWRQMNWKTISIARAGDVAKLDVVVGSKK